MLDCTCPEATALTAIPDDCALLFGKDAKWILQRLDDTNNEFVNGVNGIEEETSWSALPTAVDDTKVVITPTLENVNFNEEDKLEDSENIDGAAFAVGAGPQLVTAEMRNLTKDQYNALKDLECEKNLTFYRIDNKGNFGARETVDTPATHAGIKISPSTFVVKDPAKGPARVDQSKVMIEFFLPQDWYSSFVKVAPEAGFDPLTEITP